MDPFSLTVGAVGLTDVASRLAISCFKLYEFWESLQGAPAAVGIITTDLALLSNVLQDLSNKTDLTPSVTAVLKACQGKVETLEAIVAGFDIKSVMEAPKHERLWTKLRMANKINQVEVFRKELSEVRSTLMLGLMYQNIQRPSLCFTNEEVQVVKICASPKSDTNSQLRNPILTKNVLSPTYNDPYLPNKPEGSSTLGVEPPSIGSLNPMNKATSPSAIASSALVQKFLQRSLHLAVDDLFASGTVQQLMESSLNQVTSFDTTYAGSYNTDDFDIHKVPISEDENLQAKESGPRNNTTQSTPEAPPRLSRSKICHQKSSMGVVLGSIWVRTSTLKVAEKSSITAGQLEVITSFIFYPASWLSRVGLGYGAEANLKWSPTAGWDFKISAVKAVAENSLVFDLCRVGTVEGVMKLFERGEASIKDTSPKGWTPLHFAAANGHVKLCAALIGAGADKQALAYEGPTEDALSPLAIWSEFAHDTPSAKKIEMMRVFGPECVDISELNGDGWVVGHNLIASMGQEKCRMSETSIHWVYGQNYNEILVALGANTIWYGIQSAVRAFLFEEEENQLIIELLRAEEQGKTVDYESHAKSIGHWLALRASQRDMIPLAVQAAQILQIHGYDSIPGTEFGKRDTNRLLPMLYTSWAKISFNILKSAKGLIKTELDIILNDLSLDIDELSRCIQMAQEKPPAKDTLNKCVACNDDYTTLGKGIVQPRRIALEECRATKHKYNCACLSYLYACGVTEVQPLATLGVPDETDVEEEVYKESEVDMEQLCADYDKLGLGSIPQGDPFYEAAAMLYRSQGRRWIGEYEETEILCATCFLKREKYIREGELSECVPFVPVPKSYISACPVDTFDANYFNN